jgi:hypothetical protein
LLRLLVTGRATMQRRRSSRPCSLIVISSYTFDSGQRREAIIAGHLRLSSVRDTAAANPAARPRPACASNPSLLPKLHDR